MPIIGSSYDFPGLENLHRFVVELSCSGHGDSVNTLAQFTPAGLLIPRLAGEHRESVITQLAQRLRTAGGIEDAEVFAHAVLEHEALAPQPIHWGSPQAPLVHTVVLFAVPPSEEKRYFPLVLAFSNFLKDAKTLAALRGCTQPEEMQEVLGRICF